MLQNLNSLRWDFSENSTGYSSQQTLVCKAGTLVSFAGLANDTKFENRQRVGAFSSPDAVGVVSADKLAGERQISVIGGHIWPVLIDPATTTAALGALLSPTYTVNVNAAGNVVATGGAALKGNGGENYTGLFITTANCVVQNVSGDRYLLTQRLGA
jgi:hypothetical protein